MTVQSCQKVGLEAVRVLQTQFPIDFARQISSELASVSGVALEKLVIESALIHVSQVSLPCPPKQTAFNSFVFAEFNESVCFAGSSGKAFAER